MMQQYPQPTHFRMLSPIEHELVARRAFDQFDFLFQYQDAT